MTSPTIATQRGLGFVVALLTAAVTLALLLVIMVPDTRVSDAGTTRLARATLSNSAEHIALDAISAIPEDQPHRYDDCIVSAAVIC